MIGNRVTEFISLPANNGNGNGVSGLSINGVGSALQVPPKRKKRTLRVEVSSYDRNYTAYPNSNNFKWSFKYPLKGVTEIRLVNATIPIPFFNIDVGYNTLTLQEGTSIATITITPGLYTVSSLQTSLATALNVPRLASIAGFANTYTTVIDPITNTLSIQTTGTNIFNLLFTTGNNVDQIDSSSGGFTRLNSIRSILGFAYLNYTSVNYSLGKQIIAPYPVNVNSTFRKIYLYLNFDSNIDLRSIDRSLGRKEPSAILYLDPTNEYGSYKSLNHDNYDSVIDCGSAGISRVATLTVEIRDEFGNYLNLNQRELSLLLEIIVNE